MARRQPKKSVTVVVEEQCAALRTLSRAVRVHAESLGWFGRSEAKLAEGWAAMIDDIAVGLGEALRADDRNGLGRLWQAAKTVAIPLAFVAGTSADAFSLWDHFAAEPAVSRHAAEVVQRSDAEVPVVLAWVAAPRALTMSEVAEFLNKIDPATAIVHFSGHGVAWSPDGELLLSDGEALTVGMIEEQMRAVNASGSIRVYPGPARSG